MDTNHKRSREFFLNGVKTMWQISGEEFARQVSKARKCNPQSPFLLINRNHAIISINHIVNLIKSY